MVGNRETVQAHEKRLGLNDCCVPRVTGYWKVHKVDMPLPRKALFISFLYENTAEVLVPILCSLRSRTKHYIKNSRQLKELLKEWSIQRDKILVATMPIKM